MLRKCWLFWKFFWFFVPPGQRDLGSGSRDWKWGGNPGIPGPGTQSLTMMSSSWQWIVSRDKASGCYHTHHLWNWHSNLASFSTHLITWLAFQPLFRGWLKHPQTADLPVAWDYRGRQSPSHKHMLKLEIGDSGQGVNPGVTGLGSTGSRDPRTRFSIKYTL